MRSPTWFKVNGHCHELYLTSKQPAPKEQVDRHLLQYPMIDLISPSTPSPQLYRFQVGEDVKLNARWEATQHNLWYYSLLVLVTHTHKRKEGERSDNIQKRESKDAHLCDSVIKRVKIIYLFHMLSYDYAKMNKF